MQSTRLLPPQFLCPSWTPREFVRLTQRRTYATRRYKPRRWAEDPLPEDEDEMPTAKPHEADAAEPEIIKEAKRPAPSLFEELFPEDVYASRRKTKPARNLGKLPAFDWRSTIASPGPKTFDGASKATNPLRLKGLRNDPAFVKAQEVIGRQPAVLLMSALPKTLEESDFYRLSPKGEHIEGWSNGLIKVIQARDTQTLTPLSFYFLIFTSAETATIYRENLIRLHALSKTQSFITKATMPLPTNLALKPGEDIETLLRSFTLVPSTSRIAVRLLREPFTAFMQQMVEDGIHAAVKEQQSKGDALVLLNLESHGQFSEFDIQEAMAISGRKRNLPWKMAGGRRDIEKINEAKNVMVDRGHEQDGRKSTSARGRESRFVIALKDRHEARRFVREWHRLPMPYGRNPPMVDAQILW